MVATTDVDSEEETVIWRGSSTRNVAQTKVFEIKTTAGKSYPGEALAQENSESDESSDEDGVETEDTAPCPSTSCCAVTNHAAADKVDVEVIDNDASGCARAQIHAEKKAAARAPVTAPAAVSPEDRAATSPEDRTVARPRWRIPRTQPKPPSAQTSPPQAALRPLGHAVHGDVGMLNAPPPAPAIKQLDNKPLAEPPAKPLQPPLQPVPAPVPAAVPPRNYLAEFDPRLERPVTPTMSEGGFGSAPFQPSTPPETKPSGWGPHAPNSDGALRNPELLPDADALASPAAVASAAAAATARFRAGGAATHEKAPVRSLTARDEILREMAAAPTHQTVATAEAAGAQATVSSARAALPFERNHRDKQGRVRAWEAEEPARKRPRGQAPRWEAKRPRQHECERGGRCQRDNDASRRESDLTLRELRLERDETMCEYEHALHRQKQNRHDGDASRRENDFRLREAHLKLGKAELEYERALHRQQQSRPARDDHYHRGNGYCGRTFKR